MTKEAIFHNKKGKDVRPQFQFKNIGPLLNAEIELGDLTIIAGRNNTGKSYLVYTLYGFLKSIERASLIRQLSLRESTRKPNSILPDFQQISHDILTQGSVTLDARPIILNRQRNELLKMICRDFSRFGISDVFSVKNHDFHNASISCEIFDNAQPLTMQRITEELYPGSIFEIYMKDEEIKINYESTQRRRLPIGYEIARLFQRFLLGCYFPIPLILSAERFGISLFYRELDFTKNQLVNLLQKISLRENKADSLPFLLLEESTSRYALPIKDNIDYTRSLPERSKDKSDVFESDLEKSVRTMMGGRFTTSEDEIRFISRTRKPNKKFDIPLHLASSSVRGMSDLFFYLRHVASLNHVLVIDEPESHLDTANQILMARLIANIVNLGIKVVITTHSDYLIKEINNLIMLSQIREDQESIFKKLKYNREDVLHSESVRAYVTNSEGLSRCDIDQFGIDMPVFDETLNDINSRSDLLASHIDIDD